MPSSARPRPSSARSRRAALLGALALAAPLVTACGHSSTAAERTAAVASSSPRVVGNPATWPLTGLPVGHGQSAVQKHPVLVLKMDNTPASAPQLGLGQADLVAEELVEGGITRLAAFYYSQFPGVSGPVRSMRASDVDIVSPEHATLVTSGAARVTLGLIHKAGLHYVTEGSPGFARSSTRIAPYNLMADLTDVVRVLHDPAARPPDYLPWGPASAFRGASHATTISARFSGSHTTYWRYTGGHYLPQNSNAAPGQGFVADNVLVLRVREGNAGYLDPAGNPVPKTLFTGTGDAVLFHGGRAERGTWSKGSATSPIRLQAGSHQLTVPAGHTWIELVPTSTGSVTWH